MKQNVNQVTSKAPAAIFPLTKTEAKSVLQEVGSAFKQKELGKQWDEIAGNQPWLDFLGSALSLSPYLKECALRHPEFLYEISAENLCTLSESVIAETRGSGLSAASEAEVMRSLRVGKARIALLSGLADLAGWWQVSQVTSALADYADASLAAALDFQLLALETAGKLKLADASNPQHECGLVVLGMGKHGAHELNYSSDIDIVIFFDGQAKVELNTDDPTTLWTRFARQLIKIMQERTADGYVFRTDLRLRPDPSSTPLVIPVETAMHYYEAHGQNWERAAFIKARAVAGDFHAGQLFLKELAPFIWRRHLDYAAIQDVHSIKRQIHAHKGHGEIAIKGHNVKLGRGGIREIEFFAQTQQLIAGGRVPQLRKIRTLEALQALTDMGWVAETTRKDLEDSYEYLRRVEHRLQMVRDEQTHSIPEENSELKRIALMMGYANVDAFSQALEKVLRCVEAHYVDLFEAAPELSSTGGNLVFTGEDDDPGTIKTLENLGFNRPSDITRTIRGWHFGRYSAMQTSQARELLTELTPSMLEQFSKTGTPDETFFGFDRFIAGLPAGIQLFSLLKTNPGLLKLLIRILAAAPRLADTITRKPHVFDGLLDPKLSEGVPSRDYLANLLADMLERANGYEMALDAARVFALEQKFFIGIQLFNGIINAEQAGKAYTQLAEIMIVAMLNLVKQEFSSKYGTIENGRICVLGMGRLGSHELTAGSDLDLIFLYDHPEEEELSTGPKQLYASQYFLRFIQRLIAAMSAPTAEGVIYELDFRLRPSGNAGPLATHINSFLKYQQNEAWTWEAQAITRARPVAGDGDLADRVSGELQELLLRRKGQESLAGDVLDMRYRIEGEKGSKNPWNVKDAKGGLIDIEFLGQWSSLASGASAATSRQTTRAMIESADETLISSADKETLLRALEAYTYVLQLTRLCLNEEFTASSAPLGLQQVIQGHFEAPSIGVAEAALKDMQSSVREVFDRVLKQQK